MSLAFGARLGPYEIQSAIGAGGMGEVYRARDTRLDRTVAIKVLPPQLANDPAFRDRFDREARAVAALNHPHICTLYDVGRQDGVDYLVMEHLEGQTLADRLEKGALALEQALQYAIQIADALDKAHRQGIVHRDLKPGNVMLTKAGVKLLDFGLAKLAAPDPVGLAGMTMAATQNAPLTAHGTILGTLHYMAPEQLEGKEADTRADIFAFGAVVYEMATGKKAFEGKSQASLIAAILEHAPPPIAESQPLTPPALDRVVNKCLAKDPVERWQSAKDLRDELKWIAEGGSQVSAAVVPGRTGVLRSLRRERLMWLAAVLATGTAAAAASLYLRPAAVDAPEIRLQINTPPGNPAYFAIAPDGRSVVFEAVTGRVSQLWLRPLESDDARPLPGTDDAAYPFWSPDSRSIAFFADQKLKRIEVAGGTPRTR